MIKTFANCGKQPHPTRIFAVKTFANCHKTAKFAKEFIRERFLLYRILHPEGTVSNLDIIVPYEHVATGAAPRASTKFKATLRTRVHTRLIR